MTTTPDDQALADALLTIPGIRAVLLGGSRASGRDDSGSDTDLYALRRGPLAEESVRARVLMPLAEGGEIAHHDIWGPEDRLRVAGRLVEVMHFDLAEFSLDTAYAGGLVPNGYTTAFLHTLARGVPLADPHGDLADLRARLASYPEVTARRILDRAPGELAGYLAQLRRAQDRGDWTSVVHQRAAFQAVWFDALFALNRAYHPGEKRLLDHADRLPRAVSDQRARWQTASLRCGDDRELVPHLSRLADDLLDLMAEQGRPR